MLVGTIRAYVSAEICMCTEFLVTACWIFVSVPKANDTLHENCLMFHSATFYHFYFLLWQKHWSSRQANRKSEAKVLKYHRFKQQKSNECIDAFTSQTNVATYRRSGVDQKGQLSKMLDIPSKYSITSKRVQKLKAPRGWMHINCHIPGTFNPLFSPWHPGVKRNHLPSSHPGVNFHFKNATVESRQSQSFLSPWHPGVNCYFKKFFRTLALSRSGVPGLFGGLPESSFQVS